MVSFKIIVTILNLSFYFQLSSLYGLPRTRYFNSVISATMRSRNPIVFQSQEDENSRLSFSNYPLSAKNTKPSQIMNPSTYSPQLPSSNRRPERPESEEKTRERLCPKSPSEDYRYDIKEKKCSQIGTQSHCGKNMIFYSYDVSKVYGRCDCDYSATIPLVFHPKANRCYFVYQQAYCGKNEWLELNKTAQPICKENKCYDFGRTSFGQKPLASRDVAPVYVPFQGDGECVKLNEASKFCSNNDQVITFRLPRQFYSSCSNPKLQFRLVSVTGTLKCAPGTYMSIIGSCQPDFDFDFD